MTKFNVLSLFDGMSCGQIALNRLGITPSKYYASEIDKYAIKVTQANYPDTIQLGDINNWREWDIEFSEIDLVLAGSPCQGFSFAGKQLAFNDERSKLFFVFEDILNYVKILNPNVKFLLENVRMKKEHQQVITNRLGVEPIMIDSALVSAQSRKRFYWTNINEVTQPEDKKIVLKDILESGMVDREKSHCIDANYFKGGNLEQYFEKHRRQLVFSKDGLCQIGEADISGFRSVKAVYHPDGKSPTLTTMQGGHREPKILNTDNVPFNYSSSGRGNGKVEGRFTNAEKAHTLTATGYSNRSMTGVIQVNPSKDAGGKQPHMQDRAFSEEGKSHSLTASFASRTNVETQMTWRKLTPTECERLQTVPENFTNHVSNSQRYKMLGNGWTIDVIVHILSFMKKVE